MDVYGRGQQNKSATWKLRNAPDQITGPDVEELYNSGSSNPHFLPQDSAKLDGLVADRAARQQRTANPGAPAPQPQPTISPSPNQTGQTPSGASTNAQQQSQLPQQIQQVQSQMAPPAQAQPQIPPGGVNPASLQPDQAELQRQQQAQDLVRQSQQMANPSPLAPFAPGM